MSPDVPVQRRQKLIKENLHHQHIFKDTNMLPKFEKNTHEFSKKSFKTIGLISSDSAAHFLEQLMDLL